MWLEKAIYVLAGFALDKGKYLLKFLPENFKEAIEEKTVGRIYKIFPRLRPIPDVKIATAELGVEFVQSLYRKHSGIVVFFNTTLGMFGNDEEYKSWWVKGILKRNNIRAVYIFTSKETIEKAKSYRNTAKLQQGLKSWKGEVYASYLQEGNSIDYSGVFFFNPACSKIEKAIIKLNAPSFFNENVINDKVLLIIKHQDKLKPVFNEIRRQIELYLKSVSTHKKLKDELNWPDENKKEKKMSRRKFYVGIVAVTLAVLVAAVSLWPWKSRKEVRIGYQQTILYLPLFAAKEQGYFKKYGVEAELVNFVSAPDMMQALLAGQIDATGMSALDVIANVEQEKSGRVKMYLIEAFEPERNYSPDYILARIGSGIKELKDLRGKKLGIRPGITIEMYSKIILRKIGIDPEKEVELIRLAENLQAQALESGQIDALFTFDPTATIILDRKIGELVEHAVLAKYLMKDPTLIYPGSGVFSTDFVKRDPETAHKIRDAIYEAVDYITLNPQDAKRLLPKYTPISSQIAEKVNLIKWVKVKNVDKEKVQDLITLYHQNGVLKQNVDLRNAYLSEADLK